MSPVSLCEHRCELKPSTATVIGKANEELRFAIHRTSIRREKHARRHGDNGPYTAGLQNRPQSRCRPRHYGALALHRGQLLRRLQSLFGGNITIYTNLCERARSDTYRLMCEHAEQQGANAVIAMHYDATELMAGLTEVLCYGTAVIVERERPGV